MEATDALGAKPEGHRKTLRRTGPGKPEGGLEANGAEIGLGGASALLAKGLGKPAQEIFQDKRPGAVRHRVRLKGEVGLS